MAKAIKSKPCMQGSDRTSREYGSPNQQYPQPRLYPSQQAYQNPQSAVTHKAQQQQLQQQWDQQPRQQDPFDGRQGQTGWLHEQQHSNGVSQQRQTAQQLAQSQAEQRNSGRNRQQLGSQHNSDYPNGQQPGTGQLPGQMQQPQQAPPKRKAAPAPKPKPPREVSLPHDVTARQLASLLGEHPWPNLLPPRTLMGDAARSVA